MDLEAAQQALSDWMSWPKLLVTFATFNILAKRIRDIGAQ